MTKEPLARARALVERETPLPAEPRHMKRLPCLLVRAVDRGGRRGSTDLRRRPSSCAGGAGQYGFTHRVPHRRSLPPARSRGLARHTPTEKES